MTRGIAYKTGVSCINKIGGYFIFYDEILNTYGLVRDDGQETVKPPYCGYYNLESLLKLKGLK